MGNVIDDVEARNVLHAQKVNGLRLLLTENRDQDIGACHFLFAARLHVIDGALQDALKAERRLDIAFVSKWHQRCSFINKFNELASQLTNVRVTRLENFVYARNIEQGQQQVLDGHEFMTSFPRILECFIQTKFEFTRQHRFASVLRILPLCTSADVVAAVQCL